MKLDKNLLVVGIVVIALVVLAGGSFGQFFAITGDETMTRTVPALVDPGSTFEVNYTVSGASGSWAASVVDSATGGCLFPAGTGDYKSVMVSDDGPTKTITLTAPLNEGSCSFVGDYKFGTFDPVSFASASVNVCTPTCVRPVDLCVEGVDVNDGCGGTCTGEWLVVQNTFADTTCDDVVDRTELGSVISDWMIDAVSRDDLGVAIVAWVGGG